MPAQELAEAVKDDPCSLLWPPDLFPSLVAGRATLATHAHSPRPSTPSAINHTNQDEKNLDAQLDYLAGPGGFIAGINDTHPVTSRTALAEATQLNSVAMARRLLACGANPRVGHPLLLAAACGFDGMVELLLDAGG